LPAGVVAVKGSFDADDAVEVATAEAGVFAKGLTRMPSGRLTQWQGRRTDELPPDLPHEVVHRDDLVLLG
jgi:glutamate 5-kinase